MTVGSVILNSYVFFFSFYYVLAITLFGFVYSLLVFIHSIEVFAVFMYRALDVVELSDSDYLSSSV